MNCKKLIGLAAVGLISLFITKFDVYADSIATISGDNVNVREESSTNSAVINQYNSGEAIDIVSYENGWYRIKESNAPSGEAFVTGDYVIIVQVDALVNTDNVNIRKGSNTDSLVLGKLHTGDKISVTGREGNFYAFNMGGSTGFIHIDFITGDFLSYVQHQESEIVNISPEKTQTSTLNSTYALVKSKNGINFRRDPSESAEIITAMPFDDAMDVIDTSGDWYKVSYAGSTGYVKGEFVSLHTGQKPERNTKITQATALVNYAKKFLGTPYSWGGTNLNKGVDCSGFVYSVFKNFGISLNRTSRDQIKNGTKVSKSSLMPGDLVFFDTSGSNNGSISHVGIYMGNGQFIHSSSSKRSYCVTISSLSEDYYIRTWVAGARIF